MISAPARPDLRNAPALRPVAVLRFSRFETTITDPTRIGQVPKPSKRYQPDTKFQTRLISNADRSNLDGWAVGMVGISAAPAVCINN